MLQEYFRIKAYGEKGARFHCDNCAGQNKNKTTLHYLSRRCAKGLNTELHVNIHFMTMGHTKCTFDGCCRLARTQYIRSESHCVSGLVNTINSSASCNEVLQPTNPHSLGMTWNLSCLRTFEIQTPLGTSLLPWIHILVEY